jgi:NTP pyrophosphatase (non-canonical NTP hydrolase)
MTIAEFQRLIADIYGERDAARGLHKTFAWFIEEVGELARSLLDDDAPARLEEFGDVLAWLTTTATLAGVDLEQAAGRYAAGCPKCGGTPCTCP